MRVRTVRARSSYSQIDAGGLASSVAPIGGSGPGSATWPILGRGRGPVSSTSDAGLGEGRLWWASRGPEDVRHRSAARTTEGSVSTVTVFGAGAMGTALAMHAARRGLDVALWANAYDERALEAIRAEGKHPALPEHVPSTLSVHGPEDLERAAEGCEFAIMGASSAGARALARVVGEAVASARFVVSLAKGLENESGKRPSI